MADPSIVEEVRKEVKEKYVCDYCGASKRATVHWERTGKFDLMLEIECNGFLPGGVEKCGHTQIRHYAG